MTLLVLFPFLNANSKKQHIQRWSKRLLKIFGIQLQVNNADALIDSSYLLAANHVSWMDIHAINTFKPIRFVAKSEVEQWPIFGWMAKQLGTVFINRESSRHARQVVTNMAVLLTTQSICIFPEGTSTIGKSVQTFKPNLFEAAAQAEVPVCTLALAYFDRITGQHSEVPAFIGDMGLIGSMASILKNRRLRVELTFFPPLNIELTQPIDRKTLAQHSEARIAQYLAKNCN
ncbi:1-acyl-sn-glycerol-3-phosphate acyltransferase [Polynucleobacter sp. MWH-Berg-3C6]|uniref:lysophospholipid acyltransferase family protein n=1 Tax=Polynucleobacter sp. MWH-Berg-3C6 TaxID=1855882 RepID=UPI001C0CCDB7|nr:lysophospholipid acyltransferase family protein [Polynucleobacter sp. MWH-Berg-3C6]